MTTWTCFDVTLDAGVAHVRMIQPQRHNAMTPAFWAEIPQLFRQRVLAEVRVIGQGVLHEVVDRDPIGRGEAGSGDSSRDRRRAQVLVLLFQLARRSQRP